MKIEIQFKTRVGTTIGKVIKNIDPRFFKVATMSEKSDDDKRKPFLYRHFIKIPEAGKYEFLDGSLMDEITKEYLLGELTEDEYKSRLISVRNYERSLTDNGYLVLKFFFHIDKKEQKKRIDLLLEDKNTKWRVSEWDKWQCKHYDECLDVFDSYLRETNQSQAPWYIIDAKNKKWAEVELMETLVNGIDMALSRGAQAVPVLQNVFPLKKTKKLSEISLDKTINEEKYREELDRLQKKLAKLHNEVYRKRISELEKELRRQ